MKIEWRAVSGAPLGADGVLAAVASLDNDWELEARTCPDDEHKVVFRSLTLRPASSGPPPLGGVTSGLWRSVSIGHALDEARDLYMDIAEFMLDVPDDLVRTSWDRPGPAGRDDLTYARLALAYRLKVLRGTRTPVEELAADMNCSRATASTRVSEARRRLLLTAPESGRYGGRLTSKAKTLLGLTDVGVL